MKVKEKLLMDLDGLIKNGPINIVILGDSISHGSVGNDIDYEKVYWNILRQKLNEFRNYIPVNIINAAIGATTAHDALSRLKRDVLTHNPDLVIVCFGLNDVNGELETYLASLREIFNECRNIGADLIFMTPNMLNTYVAEDTEDSLKPYAAITAEMQNNGKMDRFINAAINLADSMNITVCDCYKKWKEISKTQDVTMLLGNRINHPNEEMHRLFAESLYPLIMGGEKTVKPNDSTMYSEH